MPDKFSKGWHARHFDDDGVATSIYQYLPQDVAASDIRTSWRGGGVFLKIQGQQEHVNYWGRTDRSGNYHVDYTPSGPPGTNDPEQLFRHQPAEVTDLYTSDKSLIPQAMKGLGMAIDREYPGGGGLPTYSRSLSSYSSKLVHHAQERGINVPTNYGNRDAQATNPVDFDWSREHINSERPVSNRYSPVSDLDQARGRRTLRSILGRDMPQRRSPDPHTYEQLSLF